MLPTALKFNRAFFSDLWGLVKPYWSSNEKWSAWALLILNVVCVVGEVQVNVAVNKFHKLFYNALQSIDKAGIIASLEYLALVSTCLLLTVVGYTYFHNMLALRWRRWLTDHYLQKWLGHNNHYHMQMANAEIDNPDQRISEDLEKFPSATLSLFLGPYKLLHSVLTIIAFGYLLWGLSPYFVFQMHNWHGYIPGYLFWVTFLYAIFGTWLIAIIGKRLTSLQYTQQRNTADFRFGLVRVREASEQISLYRGEASEQIKLVSLFQRIYTNFKQVLFVKIRLQVFQKSYGYVSYILGFAVSLPYYFAKAFKLGTVMQISSAFNSVQGGFSTLIECFNDIAEWRAVIHRLAEFTRSIEEREKNQKRTIVIQSKGHVLQVKHLKLCLPNGKPFPNEMNLIVSPGESLLITGPTGSGKSISMRALAGLWLHGEGNIFFPEKSETIFLPQKPYLPLGSLKEILCYPQQSVDEGQLREVLAICRLTKFESQLMTVKNWSQVLSLGEQQLIAFARLFLLAPSVIFLDETTSALDEATEEAMYGQLKKRLPDSIIVSVGHRRSLRDFHDAVLDFTKLNESELILA